MLRVGLTGGLACGKSFVGHALAELGCYLIEADKLGHEVMRPGAEAYDAIVREFGSGVVAADGLIDRRKLSLLVWNHHERLAKLNSFVHPAVWARERQRMAEIGQADPAAIAVVEAAILVETGSYKTFDKLIVVTCTAEQQMERAMQRASYTQEEVRARMGRQLPIEEKVRLADYVIDTSGSKENTLEQVRTVYASLLKLTRRS
jgi:dephospho-CoA kinase